MSGGVDPCTALKAADIAYMKLMNGGALRVVVDQNGERVEFGQSNAASLLRYMSILQPQCADYTAVALNTVPSVPVRFLY